MKNLRQKTAAKALAVLLFLAVSAGGFWASIVTISRWDELWSGGNFYESSMTNGRMSYDVDQAFALAGLCQTELWDGTLNYRDQQRRQALEEAFSTGQTNFRFQIHDQTGKRLCGNAAAGTLEASVHQVYMTESIVRQLRPGEVYVESVYPGYRIFTEHTGDYKIWDSGQGVYLLKVSVDGASFLLTPQDQESAIKYGWTYDGEEWNYDVDLDSRVKSVSLVLEYGLAEPLAADDYYRQLQADFVNFQDSLPLVAVLALALDLAAVFLLVFLLMAAGHRAGVSGLRLNWHDRVPYDLYLLLDFCAYALILSSGDAITFSFNSTGATAENVVGLAVLSVAFAGVTLALLLTTAARLKVRGLMHGTLIWRLLRRLGRGLRACGRWLGSLGRNWPLVWRVGLAFGGYLAVSILTVPTIIFFFVWQGAVFWAILRWLKQWRAIRAGTGHIVGGDPDYRIATQGMFPHLKEHAAQLNDLGGAIGSAVEERLKSERFKTELITNVSHDLKTPLTSIINYVDLLKKAEIENPQALEYLEVLERKSQRLKKLTEDLVEASKASTGSLTVVKTRLGMCQLLDQAAAEYQEKLAQKGLTPIFTLPEEELYVEADGRHVWRIIDNLLGNCYKYAMEGTRIYLNVARWDGMVSMSIKNVSSQQLNIPPEQLMERFVRGEESRSTEGSGLGLSIARSLTELQGGVFRLDIDGDLFKATVSFPEASREPLRLPERKDGGTPAG